MAPVARTDEPAAVARAERKRLGAWATPPWLVERPWTSCSIRCSARRHARRAPRPRPGVWRRPLPGRGRRADPAALRPLRRQGGGLPRRHRAGPADGRRRSPAPRAGSHRADRRRPGHGPHARGLRRLRRRGRQPSLPEPARFGDHPRRPVAPRRRALRRHGRRVPRPRRCGGPGPTAGGSVSCSRSRCSRRVRYGADPSGRAHPGAARRPLVGRYPGVRRGRPHDRGGVRAGREARPGSPVARRRVRAAAARLGPGPGEPTNLVAPAGRRGRHPGCHSFRPRHRG